MTQEQSGGGRTLCAALLTWYDSNRRSLPWREDPSPYHIWISEIMLQQTRVEAVRGYYMRFLERFPDIRALAEAEEDTCLKYWEGLGYYSRARNLQKAARVIEAQYGGEMPRTAAELRKLPGIGPYTSAAIASIAFGERVPAVDGNLLRVFARLALYGQEIRKPAAAAAAEQFFCRHIPQDRPGDFNQALMDLGAGICIPGAAPDCGACPLQAFCRGYAENRQGMLPVMPEKKERPVERRTILRIRDDDRVLLRKRPAKGLLAGLYELPNEEGWLSPEEAVERARSYGCEPLHIRALPEARHVFTHRIWHMRGYELRIGGFPEEADGPSSGPSLRKGCFAASIRDLTEKHAIPSAYSAFLPEKE